MKNNKGFTLIELIIVLALISVVLVGAFSVLSFGNTVQTMSMDEFEVQATSRLTASKINNIARYSSAVFTIPKSSFRDDNLTDSWNYLGIMDGEVVLYEYKKVGEVWDHYKTLIAEKNDEVNYEIVFTEVKEDFKENILGFRIVAKPAGYEDGDSKKPTGHITILSQTESLNSLQIIHKGDGTENATAIAYRTTQRDKPKIEELKPVAQIALVLDTSGSMKDKINGTRKIKQLKNSASTLLDSFASTDYPHYVSLIPFSTSANYPSPTQNTSSGNSHPFYSVKGNIDDLKSEINDFRPNGGTNTGDGLRRGYYNLLNPYFFKSDTDFGSREVSNYLIILVDGVSTYGSVQKYNPDSFYLSDGNIDVKHWINSGNVAGDGGELDKDYGEGYVFEIGKKIIETNIKVYVIGFGREDYDFKKNLTYIGKHSGAEKNDEDKYYYLAGDEAQLDIIFGEIQKEILNDLWYIDGPDL